MSERDPFHQGIIECLPHLRGFAHLLARNHALAEDLVQETVLRAISHRDQFEDGTNLRGWLVIILRNRYFNERRRDAVRMNGALLLSSADTLRSGGQEETLELRDFARAFDRLPATQREALLLVGVNGNSYEEAAAVADCAVGTMKSRVSRARAFLQTVLGDTADEALAQIASDEEFERPRPRLRASAMFEGASL